MLPSLHVKSRMAPSDLSPCWWPCFRRMHVPTIEIGRPVRQPRGRLLTEGGIERAVQLAAIDMGATGAVFIILDSEGDCPAELGPLLLSRAQNARPDKRVTVVLAHHEFEAWFLASASSLAGRRRLRDNIHDHPAPETVPGCKEWLEQWMPPNARYSETTDQAALAAVFNLATRAESAFIRQAV